MRGSIIWILPLALASVAAAQTPSPATIVDLRLIQTAAVYDFFLMTGPDVDLKEACCMRSDVSPIIELGCQPATEANTKYPMRIVLEVTLFDNAEVHCYLVNLQGQRSDYSPNFAAVDFSPPYPN